MKQYKPKEFAEMINVSVKTLQRWDKESVLTAYRNPKGRRYYTEEQYRQYMGIPNENKVGKTVIYECSLSIIHVFSCRIYGLRKYKKKMSEDKDL